MSGKLAPRESSVILENPFSLVNFSQFTCFQRRDNLPVFLPGRC